MSRLTNQLTVTMAGMRGPAGEVTPDLIALEKTAILAAGFATWAALLAYAPQMVTGDRTLVAISDTGTHASVTGDVGATSGQTPNAGSYQKQAGQASPVRVGDSDAQVAKKAATDLASFTTNISVTAVTADKTRLSRPGGVAPIDLNSDGSLDFPGSLHLRPTTSGGFAVRGSDNWVSLAIEPGFTFLNGLMPVITAAGTLQLYGPAGLLIEQLENGDVNVPGFSGGGGNAQPVLTDMTRSAGWGSSTMYYLSSYLSEIMSDHGVAFYSPNMSGKTMSYILNWMGAKPFTVATAFTMPADTTPVVISLSSGATASYTMPCVIAGRAGTLTGSASAWTFTPAAAGPIGTVAVGTQVLSSEGIKRRTGIQFVNLGKNNMGGVTPTQGIIDDTVLAYNWCSAQGARLVLVIGHFINGPDADGTGGEMAVGSAGYRDVLTVNAALNLYFNTPHANNYIDLQGFCCENVAYYGQTIWQRTGLTPTTADTAAMADRRLPPSLTGSGLPLAGAHLNPTANAAVKWLIQQRIAELSWF